MSLFEDPKAGEKVVISKVGDGTVRSIEGDSKEVPYVFASMGEKTGVLVSCDLPYLRWKVAAGDVGEVGVDLLLPVRRCRLIPKPRSVIFDTLYSNHRVQRLSRRFNPFTLPFRRRAVQSSRSSLTLGNRVR